MDLVPFGLGAVALYLLLYCLRWDRSGINAWTLAGLSVLSILLLMHLNAILPPGFGSFSEPLSWQR